MIASNKIKVGIIGANGQVGCETCLYLRQYKEIEVIPIVRSFGGGLLLRKMGFEPRVGSLKSPSDVETLVGDCNVIVDFGLPRGTPSQIRSSYQSTIEMLTKCCTSMQSYIFISTQSVNRLFKEDPLFTTYASTKKFAEKIAQKFCKQFGKKSYVFRLGQVHGELQSISRILRKKVTCDAFEACDNPSFTVFVFTVAEAIYQVAMSKVNEGTYVLISEPSWSWKEIHEFYCKQNNVESNITLYSMPTGKYDHRFIRNILATLKSELMAIALKYRDLVDNFLGAVMPLYQLKLRIAYARRQVAKDIALDKLKIRKRLYPEAFVVSGERIDSLSDSKTAMYLQRQEILNQLKILNAEVARIKVDASRV